MAFPRKAKTKHTTLGKGNPMTEQSPNDQFYVSSFMQGHNAEYLEQLYARYAENPNANLAGGKSAEDKIEAMRSAGIVVADSPAGLGEAVLEAIG